MSACLSKLATTTRKRHLVLGGQTVESGKAKVAAPYQTGNTMISDEQLAQPVRTHRGCFEIGDQGVRHTIRRERQDGVQTENTSWAVCPVCARKICEKDILTVSVAEVPFFTYCAMITYLPRHVLAHTTLRHMGTPCYIQKASAMSTRYLYYTCAVNVRRIS